MNLDAPARIYACVVPAGISDWTEIRASARADYEFNGYRSTGYVRADLVERLSDALRAQIYEHGVVTEDAMDILDQMDAQCAMEHA